ncbi:PQQ-dependent sugar dehydrogenase [Bacillus sp. 1P06AnD]|uniref:PQQ-dependent sugar dehydrogenase n=1 Tax=Bacillus sp. 1P06AnD TaxID=3132208 RepID=UPI0039A1EAD0
MINVKISLRPIVHKVNLPTVLKTAILPGDSKETLFIATQVGEIFSIRDGVIQTFLDIRQQIIKLGGSSGGYDERGLLGLAFHPQFNDNSQFYIYYSEAGTQGPGALPESFSPNPCDPKTLNLRWINRETQYDHIDTLEEWILSSNGLPQKRRTLLNIKRPFSNHNGVNCLTFSPETGRLVITTGDGGSGYDPFNLSQNDMEIAGKIIEMNVDTNTPISNPPVVTRFNELPVPIQETLWVLAKGVRNIPGISFQRFNNQYIKYAGMVGQDLVESIFSFSQHKTIPVTQLVQAFLTQSEIDQEGFINFGWRAWEGIFPTPIIKGCSSDPTFDEKTMAYYHEAVACSVKRLPPLTSYFHKDPRPDKFRGTALTGVQAYMGKSIPALTGNIVFTDLARKETPQSPARDILAYTNPRTDCTLNPFSVIQTDYQFGTQSAYYVSLGANLDQSILYLGVYGSMKVADLNQGMVFGIIP